MQSELTLYCGVNAFSPKLKNLVRDIRPQWLLEELGVPYKRVEVDFSKREHKTPQFLKLNPFGKIPALTDGDLAIFESGAICLYLAEKFEKFIPLTSPLANSEQIHNRSKCLQWIFAFTTTLEPLLARAFAAQNLFPAEDAFQQKVLETSLKILNPQLQTVDEYLSDKKYLVGNQFSLADIIACSVLMYGKPSNLFDSLPSLSKYFNHVTDRPACKKAMELNTKSLK